MREGDSLEWGYNDFSNAIQRLPLVKKEREGGRKKEKKKTFEYFRGFLKTSRVKKENYKEDEKE
jgi:hypothetical protein